MARGKGKAPAKQSTLRAAGVLPTLKKPAEAIGLACLLPGKFWDGCPAADKAKKFRCIVREFEAVHKFPGSQPVSAAFEVQEMGEAGEGSLEPGVASGDVFWLTYPQPFLEYFYDANPDKMPATMVRLPERAPPACEESAAHAQPARLVADRVRPPPSCSQGNAPATGTAAAPAPTADGTRVEPEDPDDSSIERKSKVYDYLSVIHDDVIAAGRHRGRRKVTCICKIPSASGPNGICGVEIQMTGSAPGRAPSTSNAVRHIKTKAGAGDIAHADALRVVNATSKDHVEINGAMVLVQSFEESFTHLVDYVWMVADGVPQFIKRRDSFRTYVRGYEERARFPDDRSVHRVVDVITRLQRAAQLARIKKIVTEFKETACLGIQLDMWTNSDTHTSYAAITISHVDA